MLSHLGKLTADDREKTTKSIEKETVATHQPFILRDEQGNAIDPIHDINTDRPYSPEQTCGECHDYNKITEGYHFTQGKEEVPPN
ncbi:MAG: hypothetical protein LWW99_11105 [Deltaproteobacteria bacterium]|nr:hypothetical protein [Deltaproteobacteria bacterium]